jgi:hypothetical protein
MLRHKGPAQLAMKSCGRLSECFGAFCFGRSWLQTRAAFGAKLRAEFLFDATRARPKAVPQRFCSILSEKYDRRTLRRVARSSRRLASSISSNSRHCGTGRQSHASPFPGHWTKAAVHPNPCRSVAVQLSPRNVVNLPYLRRCV